MGPRGTLLSHAAALHPRFNLVGTCDISVKLRTHRYLTPHFSDLGQAIEQIRPDVAIIATPPETHAKVILFCLKAGLHVICECPLVNSIDEASAVYDASKRYRRHVFAAESFNYLPVVQRMKRFVTSFDEPKIIGGEGAYLELDYSVESSNWRMDYHMMKYITHSLGPLLYLSESVATTVSAIDPLGRRSRTQGHLMPMALLSTDQGAGFYVCHSGLIPRAYSRWSLVSDQWTIESDPYGDFKKPPKVFLASLQRWTICENPSSVKRFRNDIGDISNDESPEIAMLSDLASKLALAFNEQATKDALNASMAGLAAVDSAIAGGATRKIPELS